MKRLLVVTAILSALFLALAFIPAAAAEENDSEVERELTEKVEEGLDAIDFSELEEWAKTYGDSDTFSDGVKKLVENVLNGNAVVGFEEFSKTALDALTGGIVSCIPAFAAIFAIAVMMEHGNSGNYAKNVAKDILDQYFGFYTWDEDGNKFDQNGNLICHRLNLRIQRADIADGCHRCTAGFHPLSGR